MTRDAIPALIAQVAAEPIRRDVVFLAEDPLPFRKLNYTRPGLTKTSLEEADDFIAARLESLGYVVAREPVQVQALRPAPGRTDAMAFLAPMPTDPWYTAHNLSAERAGVAMPDEIIQLVAHKDSQSWIDSPGAYDNAVGAAAMMEIARVLANHQSRRTLRFLFCNEEHWPWTSIAAAEGASLRGDRIIGVLNLDGLGGKSKADADAGRRTNVTLYSAPEGRLLAELMSRMNAQYDIGLGQRVQERPFINDDDGSFVKAGYPAAVITTGSFPYDDPNYHSPGDVARLVDAANVAMATRATLATVVRLDCEGSAALAGVPPGPASLALDQVPPDEFGEP